jgi:AcrR family transcriptional regulator
MCSFKKFTTIVVQAFFFGYPGVVGVTESVDPRIRRTRLLLQQALENLLKKKNFDDISVQEIADAATVNRVTFYDHYTDKFALLECVVATRFQELLRQRDIKFDCSSALLAIVLGVCDFLAGVPRHCSEHPGQMEPHLESAVIAVVRRMLLDGLQRHPSALSAPPELIATTVTWAIYGAAQEWLRTPSRPPSDEVSKTIVSLVSPILHQT